MSSEIALFFTLLAICLELYSFNYNSVAHSASFSAIIATTRNSDIDDFSKGNSLSALPLDRELTGVKVRFWVLYLVTRRWLKIVIKM